MTYRFVEKEAFRVVGTMKRVPLVFQGPNPDIEEMWKSLDMGRIQRWKALSNTEPAGIISASTRFSEDRMTGKGTLDHYIGAATTGEPQSGEAVLEVAPGLWAVFENVGKFPETLQILWGRIYSEWFPSVAYEVAPGPEILWNEGPDTNSPTFRSEIWIPVQKKRNGSAPPA